MADERRNNNRKKFGYYMRVVDNISSEVVGYLTDISPRGFRVDSLKPLTANKDYTLRLDLTPDISDRSFIIFIARAKWIQNDPMDPNSFVDGFQIVNISPHDEEIFNRILNKYAVQESRR
ncbi:MAG: PilZ domain-containing protein [Chloroflexi bacterium]|nr:PilZ domain-containing protein [Chloroflexota bacterium]